MNAEVYNYMFGSILAMSKEDVILSAVLSSGIMLLFIIFYNRIFAVTFDESFAEATGTKTELYNMLIAVLTAVTIVVGMRMMGAMLISALVIFPALSSMRVFKTFKSVTVSALIVSVSCFLIGFSASYLYDLPTGASIVVVNILVYSVFSAIGFIKNRAKIQ
jgi:zinc transport system permease protein